MFTTAVIHTNDPHSAITSDRLPDHLLSSMAPIAGGLFLCGTWTGYPDEGPPHWVTLPPFQIGVDPVTNQEYAAFVAAAPPDRLPDNWPHCALHAPSSPVVDVTWYDATTYCAWLQGVLEQRGLLAPELVVRLPSEAEWEKAASWDPRQQRKRRYPWGDTWERRHVNCADVEGRWPLMPVGQLPDGVSAYGVHDLLGNVWEWTASRYTSYPGAAAPFCEADQYVIRGGSCALRPTHLRCTYRARLPAVQRRDHLGFRIVIGPPVARTTAVGTDAGA